MKDPTKYLMWMIIISLEFFWCPYSVTKISRLISLIMDGLIVYIMLWSARTYLILLWAVLSLLSQNCTAVFSCSKQQEYVCVSLYKAHRLSSKDLLLNDIFVLRADLYYSSFIILIQTPIIEVEFDFHLTAFRDRMCLLIHEISS